MRLGTNEAEVVSIMQEARRRDAAAEMMSLSEYPVTVKARDRLVDRYIEAVGSDSYITGRKRNIARRTGGAFWADRLLRADGLADLCMALPGYAIGIRIPGQNTVWGAYPSGSVIRMAKGAPDTTDNVLRFLPGSGPLSYLDSDGHPLMLADVRIWHDRQLVVMYAKHI